MRKVLGVLAALATLLVLAFFVFRTPDTDPSEMRAKYGAAPSQFLTMGNGLTVHLRDEGPRDAPAIVLLHGSNADLHAWDAWTADLAKDHRVVRFDQIGHGLTGPNPDGDYSQTAFVNGVQAVVDRLRLQRFVLAGNSMGGGVAIAYALAHPQRLDGLVLIDSVGAPLTGQTTGNIGFKLARIPAARALMEEITPRFLVAKSFRQSVANQAIATEPTVDRYWELLRYPGNRAATVRRFSQKRHPFSRPELADLKAPVLVLWGERDSIIPVAAGRWLADAIPGAQLIVYPGIGHIPMEEAASRSASDLRVWLKSLPKERAWAAEVG